MFPPCTLFSFLGRGGSAAAVVSSVTRVAEVAQAMERHCMDRHAIPLHGGGWIRFFGEFLWNDERPKRSHSLDDLTMLVRGHFMDLYEAGPPRCRADVKPARVVPGADPEALVGRHPLAASWLTPVRQRYENPLARSWTNSARVGYTDMRLSGWTDSDPDSDEAPPNLEKMALAAIKGKKLTKRRQRKK
jgi:hypothetical protein